MTTEGPPEDSRSPGVGFLELVRRQFRRPFVAGLVVLAGVAVFAPRYGPKELTFHHRLPPSGCVKKLRVGALEGEETKRSSARMIRGETEVTHAFVLPKGRYLLRLDLLCARGSTRTVERPYLLEESGEVDFDLSRECPC